jgi:hypothetical protein
MQQQLDLIVLDARHDLVQHNADDAFACEFRLSLADSDDLL